MTTTNIRVRFPCAAQYVTHCQSSPAGTSSAPARFATRTCTAPRSPTKLDARKPHRPNPRLDRYRPALILVGAG
jgi:hypothetical protein